MWKHLLQAVAVVAVGIVLCGFGSRLAPPEASYILAVLYAILYLSGVLWFAIARLRSTLLKTQDEMDLSDEIDLSDDMESSDEEHLE